MSTYSIYLFLISTESPFYIAAHDVP